MLSQKQIEDPFGGKLRVRVGGILSKNDKILLLKHKNLGSSGYLWLPPGGGVEYGESLEEALKKEFREETHLEVEVEEYLFINEFIKEPYHAIELFFSVRYVSGRLKLGIDPELAADKQILTEARFFSKEEISQLPADAVHNVFNTTDMPNKITDLGGLFTFKH